MGVRVFEDGVVREVQAGPELEEGLRSGRFQLSSEAGSIGLRDDQGNAFDVDPQDLAAALADPRFRIETDEERVQFDAVREAEESPIRAGAEAFTLSALDELTFGAASGMVTPEARARLEALREANPTSSTAGTITGIIAPALLSGGTSLAGGGARALARLTPGGLTAAAGNAAERAILARFGEGVGSRALATVGGAVTDGALSGVTHAVTQANINGTPLEGEQVLSDTLFGAALGLGGGTALAAGGAALRGAARAGRRLLGEGGDRAAAYADRLASRGLGEVNEAVTLRGGIEVPANPRARGAGQRIASRLSGADPEDLALIAAQPRRAFDETGFARQATETAESLSALRGRVDEAGELLTNVERRRGALTAALDGVDDATARGTTRAMLEGAQGRLRQAVATFEGSASGPALRQLAKQVDASVARVGDTAGAAVALGELDRVVGAIDNVASRAGDDGGRAVLTELRTALANVASDTQVFGAGGARFSELDGLAQRWREIRSAIDLDRRALGEAATEQGSEAVSRLGESFETAEELITTVERLGGDVSGARQALSDARSKLGGTLSWGELRGAAQRGLAAEDGGAVRSVLTGMVGDRASRLVGGAIGTLLGGPVGGAAGLALGGLWDLASHPVSAYRRMASLGESIRTFQNRLDTGVERLKRALGSGFLDQANPASAVRTASRVVIGLRGTPEERRAEYREVSAEIRALASDPDALGSRLERTIAPVADSSPQLADSMQLTAVRGVTYLAEHLPAVDRPTLFSAGAPLEPSQWEIDKFLRRFEAIEDPLSILDRAAEGSLHIEHREAVETVYPEVYSEIQARVVDLLGSAETRPSYQVRLQLGVLMGVPSDRSLTPEMIAALQSNYAQTTMQDRIVHGSPQFAPARVDDSFSENALSRTDEISRRL